MGRELRTEHWEPLSCLEIGMPAKKTEKEQSEVGEEPRETGIKGPEEETSGCNH